MSYKINLDIFEGPLDLLLYFIKRDEINIYDIPIAKIAAEYLEYIKIMQTLNLQVAGDFVEMASTLMRIKSQMLIPRIADGIEDETIEDPRTELVQRLLEYQRYKELGKELSQREEKQLHHFIRVPNQSYFDNSVNAEDILQKINLFDILTAFKKILDRIPEEISSHNVQVEKVTIKDQIEHIYTYFIKKNKVAFSELAKGITQRITLIVTLMAILEMMKTQQVRVYQNEIFEDFIIEKVE